MWYWVASFVTIGCIYIINNMFSRKDLYDIPGPSIFRFLFDAARCRSFTKLFEIYKKKYGDIYKVYFIAHVAVVNPEYAKQVFQSNIRDPFTAKSLGEISNTKGLFMKEGEEWTIFRKAILRVFRIQNLSKMAPTVAMISKKYITTWKERMENNDNIVIDISRQFKSMALDSLGRLVLRYDFGNINDINEVGDSTICVLDTAIMRMKLRFPYWKLPFYDFNGKLKHSNKILFDVTNKIISEKKKALGKGEPRSEEDYEDAIDSLLEIENITEKQVYDEIVNFILGGFETTGVSMELLMYLLAKHQNIQDKLRNLLKEIPLDNKLFNNLNACSYLDSIIKESMRIFSISSGNLRTILNPIQLGKYNIPVGTLIYIDSSRIHKDEANWEDPFTFNPERFLNLTGYEHSFLPFGGGGRVCVGRAFAMMEMKVFIWSLLNEAKFELVEELKTNGGLFLKATDLKMRIRKLS